MLFAAGFVAAAVSATFVGSLADRYGRRMACMAFCITYALSCLTKLSSDIVTLLVGRLLGGVATTLMYSVFESWMVTEYFARSLDKSNMSLDSMFGLMTTLNGVVAILSGVVGESVVAMTGTKTSPFMAAIVLLMIALLIMKRGWVSWHSHHGSINGRLTLHLRMRTTVTEQKFQRALLMSLA